MLNWLKQFNIFCFMDSCDYELPHHTYDCLVAAGAMRSVDGNTHSFEEIDAFCNQQVWKFAHLAYRLKNKLYPLKSTPDFIGFSDLFLYIPAHVLYIIDDRLFIESDEPERIFNAIMDVDDQMANALSPISIHGRLSKEAYIDKIRQLQHHIQRGDCYEINFCQEFYAENAFIEPVTLFKQLLAISPNPFAALYRNNDQYLLCASPERFIKRTGNEIISQPIKGTIKRDLANPEHDKELKHQLRESEKDKSENVMVVDLVRNDMSRICERNSVMVEELFGIYAFPQVYQMISTVKGSIRPDTSFIDILKALFPMGSMTGAPKYRVLELIDQYEESSRGLFSGSVGYIDPKGNLDFNVVIRSILYNAATKYLSYQAGSGITIYSDPVSEWEECLLKAKAIKQVLADCNS